MTLELLNEEIVACKKCVRLVNWRETIAVQKRKAFQSWDYWGKPVPGFGDYKGNVLVVGLAPGAHGSNRTGRMFTGDASGDFLFPALHKASFANQAHAENMTDGLILNNLFISAVCRCVPPDNKPTKDEIINCRYFLETEIRMMKNLKIIVTLGSIAHNEIKRFFEPQIIHPFSHSGMTYLTNPGITIISSYHPSKQNTQTGRLTEKMFAEIWSKVNEIISVG